MVYEMTKLGKKPIIRDTENYFFLNLDNACVELNKKEERIQKLEKEMMSMKNKKGIGTGITIDDIGTFDVYFYPNENCTYDDMIQNKKFIAKNFLHQLNKIYQYMEDNENE